jgi:hypothetical protein
MIKQTQTVSNGIIRKNGGWVMLCGNTEYAIRFLDAQNREIEPSAEAQTAGNGHEAARAAKEPEL